MKVKWIGLTLLAAVIAVTGCDGAKSPTTGAGQPKPEAKTSEGTQTAAKTTAKEDDHSGWWCNDHGIPEEECSMCSKKAAKAFQAKGDWCPEHKRAKSQCFICDPSLREKFAGVYRAKFGSEPPEPEGQLPPKKDGKN